MELHRCTGQSIEDLVGKINPNFGVVQLLWALYAFQRSGPSKACRPIVGSLGLSEITEATQSPESSMGWLMQVSIVSRTCLRFGSTSVVGFSP